MLIIIIGLVFFGCAAWIAVFAARPPKPSWAKMLESKLVVRCPNCKALMTNDGPPKTEWSCPACKNVWS